MNIFTDLNLNQRAVVLRAIQRCLLEELKLPKEAASVASLAGETEAKAFKEAQAARTGVPPLPVAPVASDGSPAAHFNALLVEPDNADAVGAQGLGDESIRRHLGEHYGVADPKKK